MCWLNLDPVGGADCMSNRHSKMVVLMVFWWCFLREVGRQLPHCLVAPGSGWTLSRNLRREAPGNIRLTIGVCACLYKMWHHLLRKPHQPRVQFIKEGHDPSQISPQSVRGTASAGLVHLPKRSGLWIAGAQELCWLADTSWIQKILDQIGC